MIMHVMISDGAPGSSRSMSIETLASDMRSAGTLEAYLLRRGRMVLLERYTAEEIADAAWLSDVVEERQRRRILRRLERDRSSPRSPITYHVDEAFVPCCFEDLADSIESSGSLPHYLTWLGGMDLAAEFTPAEIATAAYLAGLAGDRHRRRIRRRFRAMAMPPRTIGPPGGLF